MKKQYFILLAIAGMSAIMNVKAQNTPIDDFLKHYPLGEGVTHVSISQQMLQGMFKPIEIPITRPPATTSTTTSEEVVGVITESKQSASTSRNLYVLGVGTMSNMKAPEAYSSVTYSRKNIPENMFTNFKKTLLSSKYESFMEMNSENKSVLAYYLKKLNSNTNEIVVLRKQIDQFSAIYIKGEIEIDQVDSYLRVIKTSLDRQMRTTQSGMILPGNQFAFAMPSFDNLRMPEFDSEAFHLRMEEAKHRMEEAQHRMEESIERLKDREGFLWQDIRQELFEKMLQNRIDGEQQQTEENEEE